MCECQGERNRENLRARVPERESITVLQMNDTKESAIREQSIYTHLSMYPIRAGYEIE